MTLFTCEIPGRAGIKKNGKRLIYVRGLPRMIPSERYAEWKQIALMRIKQCKAIQGLKTIDFPVNLKCTFHFENRKWEQDLSNAYQGVEDILQEAGVLKNDKLVHGHDGSRKVFGGESKTVVEITRMGE